MLPFLSRILFRDMEIGVFLRKKQLSAVGKIRGSSLYRLNDFKIGNVDWSCGYDSTGGPRRSRRHGEHAEDSKTSRGLIGHRLTCTEQHCDFPGTQTDASASGCTGSWLLAQSMPVNSIDPKVDLNPGSVSVAVDRLYKKGLVSRVESERDRRVRTVFSA